MGRCRYGLCLLLVVVTSVHGQSPVSPESVQTTLARSEILYYEARFRESIQLLTPIDKALQQTNRVEESVRVKLQLALAYIGLNETSEAKARFAELCNLDPDYELDPQQVAPKVLTLFNEARMDQNKLRCATVCQEASRLLNTGNAEALLKLIQSASDSCACLDSLALDAGELFYQQGLEAYKGNDLAEALESFNRALALNPQNDLAIQYADLTRSKIQLSADRLLLDWRKYYKAREFPQAAGIYGQLLRPGLGAKAAAALEEIRGEYRKGVSVIAAAWKENCSNSSQGVSFDEARSQALLMLPDPSIAQDILAEMKPCAPVPPQPCLQMAPQLAMTRLRTRVDPDIPRSARPGTPVRLLVKTNIDTTGQVTVHEIQGGDNFLKERVKAAVEQWRFLPAITGEQARCVETELPIVLSP
jgi:tetratricopeptide (TPR) repeat protein